MVAPALVGAVGACPAAPKLRGAIVPRWAFRLERLRSLWVSFAAGTLGGRRSDLGLWCPSCDSAQVEQGDCVFAHVYVDALHCERVADAYFLPGFVLDLHPAVLNPVVGLDYCDYVGWFLKSVN